MASTYVNDLRLNEMATGDQSGSWGTVTNTNLELIAEAFSFGTEGITTNADTHTTTIADGATDPGRSMFLKYTGTLDSACTITIAPNTVSKLWFIENATSGSQNIIIKQGSGATITIPSGDTKAIYSDGAGSGGKMVDAFASLSVVDLKVQDDLTVTDDLIVGGDIDLEGSIDVNGTSNLDAVDIDGAVQIDNTVSVGVDDTGYDVKFFGDTASAYMLWDASADDLILGGAAGLSVNSAALVTGVLTTTAATVFNGGFTANAASTITTADNSDTLTLISTDADANSGPNLRLYRNSGSPADSDLLGEIHFRGRNDNSQDVEYARIRSQVSDASDGTEDGQLQIATIVAGTIRRRVDFDATETVFNDASVDIDFRVESENHTDALFVDAGDDKTYFGKSSSALSAAGIEAHPTGRFMATLDGGLVAQFNRLSNDGSILELYKDGSAVGSVGADGSAPYFATAVGSTLVGIKMQGGSTPRVSPTDGSGDITDGVATIGYTTSRFKDLYLSGGVYLGGTGSANKLDDYEEGTWTPTITGAQANPSSLAYSAQNGEYTKIGRQVTIHFRIQTSSGSGGSGTFNVSGLPFTPASVRSSAVISFCRKITNGGGPLTVHSFASTAAFHLYKYTDADDFDTAIEISDVTTFEGLALHGSLTYYAT